MNHLLGRCPARIPVLSTGFGPKWAGGLPRGPGSAARPSSRAQTLGLTVGSHTGRRGLLHLTEAPADVAK